MTTNDWKVVRIKDIGKVITGRTPPTAVTSYFGDEYPFITPSDMIGDKYISNPERGLSSKGATLLKNNCLSPKSIAVSCIGWQMGKVVMISSTSFTNQQINTIIPADQVVPDFIYYNLCTRREELKTLGSVGTRTPILIKSSFENFQILLPPLPTQHKIASILSAYDDLTENNTRRIAILEKMAQSLYREWFVHFRFPGHEKKRLVESELGLVPEGWEVKAFSEIVQIQRKGIDPSKFEQDTFEHYSIPAFDEGCMPTMDSGREIRSNKFLVPDGAILLSKINPRIPRVWLPMFTSSRPAVASTEFLVLVPRSSSTREFLFSCCQSPEFIDKFTSRAGGTSTSHQRVKPEDLMSLLIVRPERGLLNTFTEIIAP